MAHPFAAHRDHKVQHDRVHDHLKGYATGGHSDVAADKSLIRKMVKKTSLKMHGGAAKSRHDRVSRAAGGRIKKGGKGKHTTNVHVNVASPTPPALGALGAGMPPPPAVRPVPVPMPPPGMAGPPGAGGPPPGLGGGPPMPPGMPPLRAKGGRIQPGPGWRESERTKTQVQHSDGKNDGKNIGRGKPVTFKRGGRVHRDDGGATATSEPYTPPGSRPRLPSDVPTRPRLPVPRRQSTDEPPPPPKKHGGATHRATGGKIDAPRGAGVLTPHLPGGGGGGLARIKKASLAAKDYHSPISEPHARN